MGRIPLPVRQLFVIIKLLMATRRHNERTFPNWQDLPVGGRRYWKDYPDEKGGWARYNKSVSANEVTLAVVQEIYDHSGKLIAIHEKYPIDKGHHRL